VATLLLFMALEVKLGLLTVIVAHVGFCIPFAYLPIRARLNDLDQNLLEAASDLYASPWQVFCRITLPLLWPALLSGAVLAFVVSLDDFIMTFFVAGPGATTLPVYIYSRWGNAGNQRYFHADAGDFHCFGCAVLLAGATRQSACQVTTKTENFQ